jgi:hypothetical protein
MWALDVEEMESSSKINVLWWMSIKDAYRPRVSVIARFQKKGASPWLQKEGHLMLHISIT